MLIGTTFKNVYQKTQSQCLWDLIYTRIGQHKTALTVSKVGQRTIKNVLDGFENTIKK